MTTRRDFLRRTSLALAGGLLLGDAALEAFERLTHRKVWPGAAFGPRRSMTLVEAAKLAYKNGETQRSRVITMFARESEYLNGLPWRAIAGGSYSYSARIPLSL